MSGRGVVRIEMQFMADVEMVCEGVRRKAFQAGGAGSALQGKIIDDILNMKHRRGHRVLRLGEGGRNRSPVADKLRPLQGCRARLHQARANSSTLSGGESQKG